MTMDAPRLAFQGVGFGEEYTRIEGFSNADLGAICLRYDPEPRLGNPSHRVYETPGGMLNSIGLQNPGARHVVDEILPALDFSETLYRQSSGSSVEDYERITRIFDDSVDASRSISPVLTFVKAA